MRRQPTIVRAKRAYFRAFEKRRFSSEARGSYSVLEIILAVGIFAIITSGAVGTVVQGFSATRLGEEESKASLFADEGLEAVRAIQERDYWALAPGTYGLSAASGKWEFSGTQDTFEKYTRKIVVSDVYRDGSGDIVESGGILDLYTKRVRAEVTWDFTPSRHNTASASTYFTFWEAPICVWDSASVTTTLDLPGTGDGTGITLGEGDLAYVTTMRNAGSLGEFYIVDISNPTSPSVLGNFKVDDHVYDVDVLGNYAYLATADASQELVVVDVSDPTDPAEAATYDIPVVKQANDVSVEGDYAYVVTQAATGEGEFYVFDVSDPTSPVMRGEFEVGSHVYGVKVWDNRAYLATSVVNKELIILDVSDPDSPTELGSWNAPETGANAQAVDVIRAGTAYMVTRNNAGALPEFYLLAVADPTQISEIGSFDVGERANGVAATVGSALLATQKDDEEFMILDLSNPADPTKIFSEDLGGDAGGVALEDEEACVAYYTTADDDAEFQVVEP